MLKKSLCMLLAVILFSGLWSVCGFANNALPTADILNADYSQGVPQDANGHTYYSGTQAFVSRAGLENAGAFAFDENKNTGIRYVLTDADYSSLKNGFSMEVYFYLADIHSLQAIFSNQENAGFGIEVNKGACYCCAMFEGEKKYTELGFDIPNAGCWIHAVMTYDGESLCFYYDGKIQKSVQGVPSAVTVPETVCMTVGADACLSQTEDCQNPMKKGGRINCARLYSYALTQEQVCALYNALPRENTAECILQEGSAEENGVTFGVVSDVHIKKTVTVENARLKEALEYFNASGANSVFVVGDFTDGGTTEQFRQYANVCNSADIRKDMSIHESMGNHDRRTAGNRKTFVTYTDDAERCHYKINGYHFIMISPDDAADDGDYSGSLEWLKKQLEIAAADTGNLPIFVFAHHQVKNTVMDSESWYSSDLSKDIFNGYPQLIMFGGHSHISNANPLAVWQENFTVVNTATLSYYLPETSYGIRVTQAEKAKQQQVAQGLLVSVKGSQVTVKTYDLIADGILENQIWHFDTATQKFGDTSTFPYYYQTRADASLAPVYSAGDKIVFDTVEKTSMEFSVPQAKIEACDKGDIDLYYTVKVTNADNKTVYNQTLWSDYFLTPRKDSLKLTVSGLTPGMIYTVTVVPKNAYGKSGEAISATVQTPLEEEKAQASPIERLLRILYQTALSFLQKLFFF